MKPKQFVISVLLTAISVVACDSEKKGNLHSSKDGTENFDFKPPPSAVAPTPEQREPKQDSSSLRPGPKK
ncbi:hypothetical protein GTP55_13350 [Duganella sp. FT109W]|uniref:Lipoprotein n=1 Tax=Duganella margarita TaxID=2692170 RepID=A0ABW9WGU9_9BURK|nr:hypothetical protein [Duganella margarita]MYN40362.1 hypothetical protein [Duganella margarita]